MRLTNATFSIEERTSSPIFEYIHSKEKTALFPSTVGGYKTQEFAWYYLNHRNGGMEGKIHTLHHVTLDADYQRIRNGQDSIKNLQQYYTAVVSDPITNLTLYERLHPLKRTLITSENIQTTPGVIKDEYFNIHEMDIQSHTGKALYLGADMTLHAKEAPFISWLAMTINDEDGNSLYQDYIPLDWIRKYWKGEPNNLTQGLIIHNVPKGAAILKFYIWNIDKTSYSIPDGKYYLYELERDFIPQHY